MNLKFGFSTGVLHKFVEPREALKLLKEINCNAVELGFLRIEALKSGQLNRIKKEDLETFDYVSLHAPKIDYDNNEETKYILEIIEEFNNNVRKLNLIIFHPDTIIDFNAFEKVNFNIGFENMDSRKKSYQKPDAFSDLFSNKKYKLVLDLNHIYVNDQSMNLADEFYNEFQNNIAEIHLSGYSKLHDPLFETKQIQIIRAIKDFNIPIIVESCLTPENLGKEKEYIFQILDSIRN